MNNHIIGIIGAGMIGSHHIENFQKTNKARIKWLADINPEALKNLAAKHQISNTTIDYKDILNDPEVESIVICTPPKFHKNIFIDSVKSGKHVLVEKPAAMNLPEIDEMITVAESHPEIKICDCSARHSRLTPRFKMVKKIIDEGKLGDIYFIHHNSIWRNNRPGIEYHPAAKWFLNSQIAGGGPLFDWGVYDLSFHLGVLNDVPDLEKVNTVMLTSGLDAFDPGNDTYDVEEHFVVNMQLGNVVRLYWERGNHANIEIPNETRIYGTRGGIRLGYCSWDKPELEFFDLENDGKGPGRKTQIPIDMEGHNDELALANHWIDVLENKEKPAMPLELARKHLNIIFECYKKGKTIQTLQNK